MNDATHPLNQPDAERSSARIADIELGLTHPLDGHYWRDKAKLRIEALEDDGKVYGLLPHEEAELERLKELLA